MKSSVVQLLPSLTEEATSLVMVIDAKLAVPQLRSLPLPPPPVYERAILFGSKFPELSRSLARLIVVIPDGNAPLVKIKSSVADMVFPVMVRTEVELGEE